MLTLLSQDRGLIEAKARGVKKIRGTLLSSTEDFCYSDFCLFAGKSGYIVNSADKLENFFSLRNDIGKLALASYFCELTYFLTPTEENAESFLRLLCNTLYLLANDKRTQEFLKPVFELRAMAEAGFPPNLVACDGCGRYEAEQIYFFPLKGVLVCQDCLEQQKVSREEQHFLLSPPVLAAMRHVLYSEGDKLFSFKLSDAALRYLNQISEYYSALFLERTLKSLTFYKSIQNVV